MKQFAFIHKQNQSILLGSDGLITIDGRLNIFNALEYAKSQAKRVKAVRSQVYSVRIYKGSISENTPISGYHVVK